MSPLLLRAASIIVCLMLAAIDSASPLRAGPVEKRMALVIGNRDYQVTPVQTAINDANLIAQTLKAAGFEVTVGRDLDEDSLRHAFRDFADKISASGPDTIAFVYFAGYGVQFEGENYLIPLGANISRNADIPLKATRIFDYVKLLAGSGMKTGVVVLDAARPSPLSLSGTPLASGLMAYEPGPRMILTYNAQPGTVAPAEKGPSGTYAHVLSEVMREGGLPLRDVFEKVRLRVIDATNGAQVPWNSAKVETSFMFFQRPSDTPSPVAPARQAIVRSKPVHSLEARRGAPPSARERFVDSALGAVAGAVVAGPIGLVAGAVVGATAGPIVSSSLRQR